MNRALVAVMLTLSLLAFAWIVRHTYWEDTVIPALPTGEALTNPFYAVQRFTETLGSRSARHDTFTLPPTTSVVVLSAWRWSLSPGRRDQLQAWVESGGRLVVDATVAADPAFQRWSGIARHDRGDVPLSAAPEDQRLCSFLTENAIPGAKQRAGARRFWLCDSDARVSFLTADRETLWTLGDIGGHQVVRVGIGRGRVTAINGSPFRNRGLFDGDHARLFVAATELRREDDVHFMSRDAYPSLLALLWRNGAAVVISALVLAGLIAWRSGVRFGPLAAPRQRSRRSLAEQITGTGRFALRFAPATLQAASARALDETARRRISGYARLSATERVTAVAARSGLDARTLLAAMSPTLDDRPGDLRHALITLETARRRLLTESRVAHGTD